MHIEIYRREIICYLGFTLELFQQKQKKKDVNQTWKNFGNCQVCLIGKWEFIGICLKIFIIKNLKGTSKKY